jgi:hypothetical protein
LEFEVEHPMRNSTPSPLRRAFSGSALLLAGSLAIAACNTGGAATTTPTQAAGATTTPASVTPASMAPSISVGTPPPTPLSVMGFALLPKAEVPKDVKVSCEDAAGATLSCDDAVALASRINVLVTGASPVTQVLVERDAADANKVTITFWATDPEDVATGPIPFSTTIDVSGQTLSLPQAAPDAVFPS